MSVPSDESRWRWASMVLWGNSFDFLIELGRSWYMGPNDRAVRQPSGPHRCEVHAQSLLSRNALCELAPRGPGASDTSACELRVSFNVREAVGGSSHYLSVTTVPISMGVQYRHAVLETYRLEPAAARQRAVELAEGRTHSRRGGAEVYCAHRWKPDEGSGRWGRGQSNRPGSRGKASCASQAS